MIPIAKAVRIVTRESRPLGHERISIETAAGRILAENIVADSDLPPFDRSQMDGYAVRTADVSAVGGLLIVGESVAGRGWHNLLKKGQAVRIMTGAPVPKGADTVARLEIAEETNGNVKILQSVKKGSSVVKRGTEIKRGKVVIKAGERITPNNIAMIAAFGYSRVRVAKRPRIAILATGSEIVDVSNSPRRDQIRNSNSIMLKAMCEAAGAVPEIVPPVGDDLSDLTSQISKSTKLADIVVMTGGVSVGKYDLTKAALEQLGAETYFDKLRMKPGKPAVFARVGKTLVFALPGNPVSAAVTFYLLVRTAIMLLQASSEPQLRKGVAILDRMAKADKERDTYLPATLGTDRTGRLTAASLRTQGSSDIVGFARADALIFIPAAQSRNAGETVEIRFL